MRKIFLLTLFSVFAIFLSAQSDLISGIWEGDLYFRGEAYRMELNIKVKSKGRITGFSNIHLKNGKTIEMKLIGKLHMDRSINLYEKAIINEEELGDETWYLRHYQLLFKRDLWEADLSGYWQEKKKELADEKMKLGKVMLKKTTKSKA